MSTDASSDSTHTDATDRVAQDDSYETPAVDPRSLIAEERTLAFRGLSETGNSYPEEVKPTTSDNRLSDDPATFKEVISRLPVASSGDLYANNKFVDEYGGIDTAAIRNVDGLDISALEDATDMKVGRLAGLTQAGPLVEVSDHQDIIDERRLALSTLGAPVKFRWQIASNRYCIVQPADAYLPIISALQKRDASEVFGWAHYRDWGGEFKMSVLFPGLKRMVIRKEDDDNVESEAIDNSPLTGVGAGDDDSNDVDDESDEGVTIYGGVQTGYDFRGSQAVWAKPMLYVPASDVAIFGVGERRSRRHVGSATDAAHERQNDRTPISEWWGEIYDDIEAQATVIDNEIALGRTLSLNFEDVPYSTTDFYQYLGIPEKYAEEAAERAQRFASPPSAPTLWNLQLSLQVALDALYKGSHASETYQEYNEVGQQIFREPAYSIQLALMEHDRQAKETGVETQLPEDQQSLSDSIDDLVDIPGLDADTEADLSDVEAQRIQDNVSGTLQQALDNVGA
jgi:hypothetical protein